jgi:ankyrin repeat protein
MPDSNSNNIIPMNCVDGCCNGLTARMLCNEADAVKALLAAGANVHITNDSGATCLHVAARHYFYAPVICLLIKAGADLHAINNEGKLAAQIAFERGYFLIGQLLSRAAQQQKH